MANVNQVILIGRLGSDPETKELSNGNSVTNFNLATSDSWKDKSGNKQERTEWHKVVLWNNLAGLAAQYLRKGSMVYIEGALQTRSYEAQDGSKRFITEIIGRRMQLLDKPDTGQSQAPDQSFDNGPEPNFDSDEEIPF